jgi:hypothetical protein
MKDYQLRRITWVSILLITGLFWASIMLMAMFAPTFSSSKSQGTTFTKGK